jgi:hypothetical protein
MTRGRRILSSLSVFAGATFALVIAATRSDADSTPPLEMARLKAHFATVLRELRRADVANLSEGQLAARSELISRLEEYAAAGRFPHNHVVAGQRVPVFRDEHQTLCAMGYLIATTGRLDIVEGVVSSANLARIPELAADAKLRAWLDSTGLTVGEAARIQPMYDGRRPCVGCIEPTPVRAERRVAYGYYLGSAGATAISSAATALNVLSVGGDARVARRAASIGFIAGAGQILLGAFVLDQPPRARNVGIANMFIGGLSMGTSAWRIRQLRSDRSVAARALSIQPILTETRTVGLAVAARL